jgi:xanthosine utilization system XapX-like protein
MWSVRIPQKVVLALIGILGIIEPASAVPPTLNTSGLSPEQCYRRDSDCTQMCGEVTGDLRYECFSICDRMLDRCLGTGEWSDSLEVDPGTGKPPGKMGQLSAHFMRMLMILGDTDGDSVLSPKEIQSMKEKVFNCAPKTSTTPNQR